MMNRSLPAASFRLLGVVAIATCCGPLHAADNAPAPRLAFADFYQRPIGPRGLEPNAKLLALAGTRVELSGFVARTHDGPAKLAILAPTPVTLDDEDEGLADDLPAAVAYLHAADERVAAALTACRGALRVAGRLELGRQPEADGRASFVRLLADDVQCAH
jgi:hypothetical protein